jgi:hypothetical protein
MPLKAAREWFLRRYKSKVSEARRICAPRRISRNSPPGSAACSALILIGGFGRFP